ncbi:MAG TPA: hypothetical protein VKF38_12610 [Anaerolineaceae bacterium]|nr:hypothetical protein [Anaerolineaceae bacterium]
MEEEVGYLARQTRMLGLAANHWEVGSNPATILFVDQTISNQHLTAAR